MIEALRYGKGLRADELVAVHFMVDVIHAAQLRKRWDDFDLETRLRVVDCPDRRMTLWLSCWWPSEARNIRTPT